jgi:hemerythrin-like domain-containing protein
MESRYRQPMGAWWEEGEASMNPDGPDEDGRALPGGHGEQEIPPTEDLMREHGVLNRILLIYDEGVRRILAGQELPPDALHLAARLVRDFIEEYHERLEERWVFPRFERAGKELALVKVLTHQHDRGRLLTDAIRWLTTPHAFASPERRLQLARACALFSRMYRPHEAREDTELFPRLRRIVSPNEFDGLGEQFEREERRRFGADGFERIVATVAGIEKRLGIHDLAEFTP